MTMLSLIQTFCKRTNLPSPATVYGSTDPQVLQILALLEEEGTELAQRGDWQQLTYEATHTTTAAEDQGAIGSIATNGFRKFIVGTFWDRTLRLPVIALDGQDWQSVKAITLTGPRYKARIRGNRLLANPTPSAGNTWAFEYASENWILGADGTTYKSAFTLDTDTFLLPEKLFLAGLRWRWKKEKGFDYAEDFRLYEGLVSKELGNNGIRNTLDMSAYPDERTPGVYVPSGNWITP